MKKKIIGMSKNGDRPSFELKEAKRSNGCTRFILRSKVKVTARVRREAFLHMLRWTVASASARLGPAAEAWRGQSSHPSCCDSYDLIWPLLTLFLSCGEEVAVTTHKIKRRLNKKYTIVSEGFFFFCCMTKLFWRGVFFKAKTQVVNPL